MPDMLIAPAVAPRITRPMIATAIAGGIAVACDVVLFAANQDVGAIDIVLQAVVGAVWIVAGMTAWIRYPTLRTGALMIAVGVLWLSTQLYAWEGSIAVTLVRPLDNLGV